MGQGWFDLLLASLEKGDRFMRRKIKYEFTALPNKMYEALIKLKLPLYDRAVFDTIARQTFGYHLPERWIAWSVFVEMTGIDKRHISRSIHSLIKKGIIAKDGKIYSIQPDISRWEGVPLQAHLGVCPLEEHPDTSTGTLNVPVEAQTKESLKESFQRNGCLKTYPGQERWRNPERVKKFIERLKHSKGIYAGK